MDGRKSHMGTAENCGPQSLIPHRVLAFPCQLSGVFSGVLQFHGRTARWGRSRTASEVHGCGTGTSTTQEIISLFQKAT